LSTFAARVSDLAEMWRERHVQRRRLATLPDYLLRDLGIDGTEVMRESLKPFWRE
jgi:uncharacterized protein YjiS (DUF1127 family)